MFYKLREDILFRRYDEYGVITDNSEYGYRMLNDIRRKRSEKFVSITGAIMMATLDRQPKSIDDIVNELTQFFEGVSTKTLKEDTIEFFQYFVDEGYLSVGDNKEKCVDRDLALSNEVANKMPIVNNYDDCVKSIIKKNDFLRSIHIEIASSCNERCVHCYIPHKDKTTIMDSELFYRIISEGRKMNIIHVTLSGGEPLVHKEIIPFLKKCREADLSVNILSNLTLLTDEIIDEMIKNPLLSVQTSIYALNPEIHDEITRLPGSLEKTIRGVNKLLNKKIPIQISCPVMKQNKDDFVGVITWGRENNISVAIEPVIFGSYDHTGYNLRNRLSLEEIGKSIDYELAEGYEPVISDLADEKESMNSDAPICSICRYNICVSVTGKVYPCVGWQTNVVGDLMGQCLREVWEKSDKIIALRKITRSDFVKCIDCEDRGYCNVCMMSNSNENCDGDPFRINEFHCKVAKLKHKKVLKFREDNNINN